MPEEKLIRGVDEDLPAVLGVRRPRGKEVEEFAGVP
jgi:hypothetical protein